MRKLAFLALGTLFGAASFAQDPLECVDPDVRALVFPNGANMQLSISTSVPDELSAIEVPNEFSWIGSIERNLEATPGVLHAFGAAPVAVWNLESGLVASPPLGAAFVASPIASVTAAYRTNLPPNAARDLALKERLINPRKFHRYAGSRPQCAILERQLSGVEWFWVALRDR